MNLPISKPTNFQQIILPLSIILIVNINIQYTKYTYYRLLIATSMFMNE